MKPIFKIGEHDYTQYVKEDGLAPVRNDLDSDGSGRNILDGLMYRTRITSKDKWTVSMLRLPEVVAKQLAKDLDATYVDVTMLDPKSNRYLTKSYYCSTVTYGTQRYNCNNGLTYYEGMTFNLTER